ncbi:beta-lactamase regulator AmpE [Pectobacteriaceae bacterium CE70]|uniref:Regulatory signaling modulator protein AmpE n=1 Tax=Serratia sp. (strain ATCC 39006) TaxID=104623 RepID=A0A2I5TGS5_SERS3|nr:MULTISPECIES: beta-lactamase regulator AmpE [Enterobacterales]WJV57644.1 beta-lactamase regulator AmpE [Pectobacteriaceae bacterium C111]WJV61958.1 beta-lactamase regulator AmpE [Pectobacteriaceae bacterium C52]WJV66229.1 beta-lactamase regulator AmpE [Pectobacteriaceae bacterium CE70]WJY10238.1 beta-lactamase regulator AmpE [Pectobacteriaceae bacterium C80]AUG99454.1 regulatory signaling modulator protein AmpE [Serratia sp. ATCC 39006]
MTLFTLLLGLGWERLFKQGEHWQLDHHLEVLFRHLSPPTLFQTITLTCFSMGAVALVLWFFSGLLFGVILLLLWIAICLLCIGAGEVRQHYHRYLQAADRGEADACREMEAELSLIHGLPVESGEHERLKELQNALLWINFRFYLAPIFWFIVAGPYGPVALVGYSFLRARQACLARHHTPLDRARSGVDSLLHWLDWIPVRLAGVAYALLGHGEKALPAWFAALGDFHSSQYWVLTQLAQFSLAREPHVDQVEAPKAAVTLAKKVTLAIVVVVSLLTIYGALV